MESELPFKQGRYEEVKSTWPISGQHILASYTDTSIILYQAYNEKISSYALEHQTFKGCPDFSEGRMTWLKSNFLWMMYRSGWATKPNQENILAITISRTGFEEILKEAQTKGDNDVRLQWDPDHDPYGEKVARRAIQLGIRNQVLQKFLSEWILNISNITEFVSRQREHVLSSDLSNLLVPVESVFIPSDPVTAKQVGISEETN